MHFFLSRHPSHHREGELPFPEWGTPTGAIPTGRNLETKVKFVFVLVFACPSHRVRCRRHRFHQHHQPKPGSG